MEPFHAIYCFTLYNCQPINSVEVHAIEDITTPQFCSLYLHAREHLTFQGVTGPHLDLWAKMALSFKSKMPFGCTFRYTGWAGCATWPRPWPRGSDVLCGWSGRRAAGGRCPRPTRPHWQWSWRQQRVLFLLRRLAWWSNPSDHSILVWSLLACHVTPVTLISADQLVSLSPIHFLAPGDHTCISIFIYLAESMWNIL